MGEHTKLPRGVTIHRGKLRISFVYKGVRCREGLALQPTKGNIEHARRKRDIVQHDIAMGRFDYAAHFPDSRRAELFGASRPEVITVGELLDRWLESTELAPSTYRDYSSAIGYHLKPRFGDLPVAELKKSDIKAWLAGLSISNKRKNNVLIPLRGALADALDDDLIGKSPVAALPNLEVRQDEPDPFSPEEVARLLAAMPADIARLFRFAIWSGLRTGELLALAWEDVDLEEGRARIRLNLVRKAYKAPKTAAGERDLVLLDDALEALKEQKAVSFMHPPIKVKVWRGGQVKTEAIRPVWLNPATGKAWLNDQQLRRRAWEPALKKSGVRYRVPYQCRHTYASMLLSWGANPMFVAAQMGHKDWGMIRRRYGRWITAMSDSQLELIRGARNDHFGPIAAPGAPSS